MSFGQVLFIKYVLYLPEGASGDKNLCSTLSSHLELFSNLTNKKQWSYLQEKSHPGFDLL